MSWLGWIVLIGITLLSVYVSRIIKQAKSKGYACGGRLCGGCPHPHPCQKEQEEEKKKEVQ